MDRRAWLCALLLVVGCKASAEPWQPPAGIVQIPLWPEGLAIERPLVRGEEAVSTGAHPMAGRPVTWVADVTRPTMTIYPPSGRNSGAAVLVFPGGGYRMLAIDLEGTEVCDWLTARGITCVLLKYRVPGSGPNWNPDCHCRQTPQVPMALQDAQRAMGLLRRRAGALGIDPHRIGVIGFSAGGHMVAGVSNAAARRYARVDEADDESSRPDFAIALYPGHLWTGEELGLEPDIQASANTPPTFLLQAQDDRVDDVRHSLSYYMALREAGAPVELHLYAHGGHAFALRRTAAPITEWTTLAERWLRTIGMISGD